MANKGTANVSASVLNDLSKMNIGSTMTYEPADAGDKWIYLEVIADASSTALVQAGVQYHEKYVRTDGTETSTATGDIVRYMVIKHTGTTDGSTATSSGVVVSLAATGDAAHNEVEGFFLDSGDTIAFKTAACTLNTIGVITTTVTNGAPASGGTPGDVVLQVAAILDDVSV